MIAVKSRKMNLTEKDNMKVYLVEADFERWEDSYQVPLGLFKHKSKAEIVKLNYEQDIKELCDEILIKPLFSGEENATLEEEEIPKEWEDYYQKEYSKRNAQDFNFCTIVEYELNEEEK